MRGLTPPEMREVLTSDFCFTSDQVNNVQRIPTHTERSSYTAEVFHIPVQHSASRGLVQERLVVLGLREDGLVRAGPGKVGADSKGQRAGHEGSHSWQGSQG